MTGRVLGELKWRGLIAQVSDETALQDHLAEASRTIYCGFDPTADSLHIGSLVPLLALQRMQRMGHRPIVLVGGATGLIGDPSFRLNERSLNSADVVQGWVEKLKRQVEPYVSFEGSCAAILVNNLDWTESLDVISFLRDIGKHFSINTMVNRDSVRSRLEREGEGLSFTEFSYMLLQGMDYLELHRRYGCSLQIGGSDQWGNIISGIDLVRRVVHRQVYGLTLPLVTKADGSKFGKTATGTIWLDQNKTSPYAFYQFWLNTADADVSSYLRFFTYLNEGEILELDKSTCQKPEGREAQRVLAREVTKMVHGADALLGAERISSALFKGDVDQLREGDLLQLTQDGLASFKSSAPIGLLAAMVETGLARSTSEARKLVESSGVSVNGRTVVDTRYVLDCGVALFGKFHLIRKGKKNWSAVVIAK
jgi:tyrosyl-tRNA synthetase